MSLNCLEKRASLQFFDEYSLLHKTGGDASHSIVYSGPVLLGPGQDLTPVTLSFRDVNHDGKVDLVVTVAGSQFVFMNVNGTFVSPAQSGAGKKRPQWTRRSAWSTVALCQAWLR